MYSVEAYNRAKIAKQCEHSTKLELIYYFYHTRFLLKLIHENQISGFISKIFCLI